MTLEQIIADIDTERAAHQDKRPVWQFEDGSFIDEVGNVTEFNEEGDYCVGRCEEA